MCGVINVGDAKIFVLTVIFSCGCVQAVIKRSRNAAQLTLFPRWSRSIWITAWEQRKFSDVAVIRRGLTYSPTNIVDGADGVRVLRSSNINEDHFVLNYDDVFVDESAVNIDLVHDGDILITAANGSPRLVGKRARISDLPGKTVHGGFMLVASSPCSDFLCASMGSSWYRRFLATGVAGGNGAIGNLDSKALGETIIAVPNDAEIDKLGNFFTRLDSLITLHQRQSNGKAYNIIILSRTKNRQLDIAKSAVLGLETRGNSRKLLNEHPIQQRFLDIP